MYLTFQSDSASYSGGSDVLSCLAENVLDGEYLGMLGWPSTNLDINEDNLALITSVWDGTYDAGGDDGTGNGTGNGTGPGPCTRPKPWHRHRRHRRFKPSGYH